MVYKSITIIGIGTLGGFVVDAVANFDDLETLILIDDDLVETKNLKNSIYRNIDVGISKTEALSEIINKKNPDITIISMNEKYIEGKTKIPKCDLVLDCRDFTYDRRSEIDVRMYISSRYLMVDCRKNVSYRIKSEGKYLTELTKEDLRFASSLFSMLLSNNLINQLMKNHMVQKYELDHVKRIDKSTCDIIYESPVKEDRFLNLPDKIVPILEANKQSELPVYVGSSIFPLSELLIPKETLNSSRDIIINLNQAVVTHCNFNSFVVSLQKNNGRFYIELIPETGAA